MSDTQSKQRETADGTVGGRERERTLARQCDLSRGPGHRYPRRHTPERLVRKYRVKCGEILIAGMTWSAATDACCQVGG